MPFLMDTVFVTFLFQKMTFLKNIFGTSCDFHKSAEKFSKNEYPSEGSPLPPRFLAHVWIEFAAPRTFKIIENGPWKKSVATPGIY